MSNNSQKMFTLKNVIEKSIETDLKKLRHYRNILRGMKVEGRLKCKRDANGKSLRYYYVSPRNNKEIYLGRNKIRTIKALQKKRLAEEMERILVHNIEAKETFCKAYKSDIVSAVIETLPLAYRPVDNGPETEMCVFPQSENPYHRENLVIKTSFGLYVRSKSELQIAELLYSLGIEFYYEKALHLWEGTDEFASRTFYPDFTIVLPDGSEIYWEHKGRMDDAAYVERDINKEIIYNRNGIYQPHNLIVTAEGPDNEFDMEAVRRVAEGVLLPMMAV